MQTVLKTMQRWCHFRSHETQEEIKLSKDDWKKPTIKPLRHEFKRPTWEVTGQLSRCRKQFAGIMVKLHAGNAVQLSFHSN